MPRAKTEKILRIKQELILRLQHGYLRPGQAFLSNRALAQRYAVSYQTADRLISELCAEGWLRRRQGVGTFLSGRFSGYDRVGLVFHPRAKRPGSFGAHLLQILQSALTQAGMKHAVIWMEGGPEIGRNVYPVLWELREVARKLSSQRHYCLLLNDIPEPGPESHYIDSVATDDYSGGVSAAHLIIDQIGINEPVVIFAGPKDDLRSTQRVQGFRHLLPQAKVLYAASWFLENGRTLAQRVAQLRPRGIFCCNDRLAQAVVEHYQTHSLSLPPLVGFDDAPVAEALGLTTIAIPWNEMAEATVAGIKRRLEGYTGSPSRQIFIPRPVLREVPEKFSRRRKNG